MNPADQPSLVFVFADHMRAQAMGCSGNEQVQTPVIDRLARTVDPALDAGGSLAHPRLTDAWAQRELTMAP